MICNGPRSFTDYVRFSFLFLAFILKTPVFFIRSMLLGVKDWRNMYIINSPGVSD